MKTIRISHRPSLVAATLLMLPLLLTSCEAPPANIPAGNDSALSHTANPPSGSLPPQNATQAAAQIRLEAMQFPGTITLSSDSVNPTETGFEIPVFLQNVTEQDIVDTVTLQMKLPEDIRLKEVKTMSGFNAEFEGMSGPNPVVFFHPFSITADSYLPVVGGSEPIFTLEFEGQPAGDFTFEGSFFQTSGTLIRTNSAILRL